MKTYKQIKNEGTANDILEVFDAISEYCMQTRCRYCPFHFHRDDSTECECNLNINDREPYVYKFEEIEEVLINGYEPRDCTSTDDSTKN